MGLCNSLTKAVPDKFHGSCRHSKLSCLRDQANFYRAWAWQHVIIVNTDDLFSLSTPPNAKCHIIFILVGWLFDCYFSKFWQVCSFDGWLFAKFSLFSASNCNYCHPNMAVGKSNCTDNDLLKNVNIMVQQHKVDNKYFVCNSFDITEYGWVVPWGATRCRPLLSFLVVSPRYAHRIGRNEVDTVARARSTQRKSICVDVMTGVKCPVNAGKYWSTIFCFWFSRDTPSYNC